MTIDQRDAEKRSVLNANRKFYDAIAEDYEKIDGRRSSGLESWLRSGLKDIRDRCTGGRLLDLGAGSGLVTRAAKGIFDERIAVDISHKMIEVNRNSFDRGIVADIERLPFSADTFDALTCFSVLHHMYSFDRLVSEIARVIKSGGIFYSDHDMDSAFNRRFHIPLAIYRKLFDRKRRYQDARDQITPELYSLSEWQESGISSVNLAELFDRHGFNARFSFHWYGLSRYTDILFGKRSYVQGWAPLLSIVAIKK